MVGAQAVASKQYSIVPNGAAKINGVNAAFILTWDTSILLQCDGTDWRIVAGNLTSSWRDFGAMTITAATTNPTKGTTTIDKIIGRRVGSVLELKYTYLQNTVVGTGGTGGYRFAIPIGTMDLTGITTGATINTDTAVNNSHGSGWLGSNFAGAQSAGTADVSIFSSTTLQLTGIVTNNTTTSRAQVSNAFFSLLDTSLNYAFRASVPMSGW